MIEPKEKQPIFQWAVNIVQKYLCNLIFSLNLAFAEPVEPVAPETCL